MALHNRITAQLTPPPDTWPWHEADWTAVSAVKLAGGQRRLDAETYLTPGYRVRAALEAKPGGWLPFDSLAHAWTPPRIKMVHVPPPHGVPYLNTSQVFDIRPTPRKWLAFGKVNAADRRTAPPGTILVMASASVGRSTVVTDAHAGAILSHHFMRVEPRDPALRGWVYAFLQSPHGRAMMAGLQYASLIRHIEPHHLADLPVPTVDDERAARFAADFDRVLALRNASYHATLEAERLFAETIDGPPPEGPDIGFEVMASGLRTGRRRLEAAYHDPAARVIRDRFRRWEPLEAVTERVWWMSRFKRHYGVDGEPYLSANDLFAINPPDNKRILTGIIKEADSYRAEAGWLLMACSGQTYGLNGATLLATKHHERFFLSHDLIRIVPDAERITGGYLLTALTHPTLGRPLLIREAYGSSIPHLDPEDVAAFPVVRLDPDAKAAIAERAESAAADRAEADELERRMAAEAGAFIDGCLAAPAFAVVRLE